MEIWGSDENGALVEMRGSAEIFELDEIRVFDEIEGSGEIAVFG